MTTDLAYPIGKFRAPKAYTPATRAESIRRIAEAPAMLRLAVAGLSDDQLDTPYRDGGWTPRQVVHHVADSHINMVVRLKLALTEEQPPFKPYDEKRWALLPDVRLPVDASLAILDGVHARLVHLLRALDDAQFGRVGNHAENGPMSIDLVLALYAWHGAHHAGHITGLRTRMGW